MRYIRERFIYQAPVPQALILQAPIPQAPVPRDQNPIVRNLHVLFQRVKNTRLVDATSEVVLNVVISIN